MPTAEDEIRAVLAEYETALNDSDAAAAAACYTQDGVFMPTTLPTATGADLEGAYRQIFEAIALDVAFTVDELVVSDTVAYALTRSAGTQTDHASATTAAEANREMFVFRETERGWRIARYMFNKES